jgi:hypothetical protein
VKIAALPLFSVVRIEKECQKAYTFSSNYSAKGWPVRKTSVTESNPTTSAEDKCRIDESIIKALCYADIFNFPLTLEEIVRFAPGERITVDQADERLKKSKPLRKLVGQNKPFYYLKGRHDNCKVRETREPDSKQKLNLALRILVPLQGIPFLRTAMITGALAAFNSPEGDDVDLLIISAPRRAWTAYFFLRLWRRFGHNPDICFNMFLSEGDLHLTGNNQNFFYAREILGGITIFNESGTRENFFEQNLWVYDFFPSYIHDSERSGFAINRSPGWRRRRSRLERLLGGPIGSIFEYAVRKIQFRQMADSTPGAEKRMTATTIKLHKSDNRPPILNKYEHNVKKWMELYRNVSGEDAGESAA